MGRKSKLGPRPPVKMLVSEVDQYPTGDYLDEHASNTSFRDLHRKEIPCPLKLEMQPEDYARLWLERGWDSAFIDSSDRGAISNFLKRVDIQHLAVRASGWSLEFLEFCQGLRILEIRSNAQITDLREVISCCELECLIIYASNNVFSSGVPELPTLRSIVIRNVANLVQINGFVEALSSGSCPSLIELKMNAVKHNLDQLNLEPLSRVRSLRRLQTVGTRVSEVDARFVRSMRERVEISNYISSIHEDAREVVLSWSGVHGDDIQELHLQAPDLEHITLDGCDELLGLKEVAMFKGLVSLRLFNCKGISSAFPLSSLECLQELEIRNCFNFHDYASLLVIPELKSFVVQNKNDSRVELNDSTLRLLGLPSHSVENVLGVIVDGGDVSTIYIEECSGEFKIDQLSRCASMRVIRIAHCSGIPSYLPLAASRKIQGLAIVGGLGASISVRAYQREMAELQIELPSTCDFDCDVSDEVLERIHSDVDVFFDALRIELGEL